jgi:hypothetical protein
VSYRPLVLVGGLTLGDYLLWDWSLGGNHDVLALVSGLTLPLLALVCIWMLAVNAARLLRRGTRRMGSHRPAAPAWRVRRAGRLDADVAAAAAHEATDTTREERQRVSRRIAA